MKILHLLVTLCYIPWVIAVPAPEHQIEAREPHYQPRPCTTSKHPTTSTKKTTSTKHSTTSTKKITSTKHSTTSTKKSTSTSLHKTTVSTRKSTSSSKTSTSLKPTTSSTKSLAASSTVSGSSSSKSTAVSSTLSLSSSVASSLSVSIPLTTLVPSVSIPETTLSVALPVTSTPVDPVCVPNTGEAVTNGGFANSLAEWTTDSPFYGEDIYGYASDGFGLAADTGNQMAFSLEIGGTGTFTISLSQPVCLIPGAPYTYSYHPGIIHFDENENTGTGCTVAFSANDQQIVGPQPICGSVHPQLGANNVGTCTEPGSGTGFLKNYYERVSGTFVPTLPAITLRFDFECTKGSEAVDLPYLDLISVMPAV